MRDPPPVPGRVSRSPSSGRRSRPAVEGGRTRTARLGSSAEAAADRHHRAVRKEHGVVVAATDVHRRPRAPAQLRFRDRLARREGPWRRCRYRGRVRRATDQRDLAGAPGPAWSDHRGPPPARVSEVLEVSPAEGVRPADPVEEPAVGGIWAGDHRPSARHHERVRVEPAVGGSAGSADGDRRQRPSAVPGRGGAEELDLLVGLGAAVLVQPTDDQRAPVWEERLGRIPAPMWHIGLLGPGLVEGVEGVDLVQPRDG